MRAVTGSVIAEVYEHAFAGVLENIRSRLSNLMVSGPHRRFLVNRMGSTGSSWLAKVLNCHPEVFCYHEGVVARIFPATSYGNDEILAYIDLLAQDQMHGAYLAAGDVGSTWATHVTALPANTFTTAILIRHPAKLLHTRLTSYTRGGDAFTPVDARCMDCIQKIWEIDAPRQQELDQIFLQDAFIFAAQVQWIGQVHLLVQIEKMNELEYCAHALETLTGLEYERPALERFLGKPLNVRTGTSSVKEIIAQFSPLQRRWYETMLDSVIGEFGYRLEE